MTQQKRALQAVGPFMVVPDKCTWNKDTGLAEWCDASPEFAMKDTEGKPFAFLCRAHKEQAAAHLEKSHKAFSVDDLETTTVTIVPPFPGEAGLIIHPVDHSFKEGDPVIDRTAEANGWPDREGIVIKVDGSNILVRYPSGNERWKILPNLRKK